MKADISRNTFRSRKHYSSVIMQQGRVLLDADFNEQSSILLHYMRALARDLIGPNGPNEMFKHGGPGDSFKIIEDDNNGVATFSIMEGHYYVDGILCENRDTTFYNQQRYWPLPDNQPQFPNSYHLVFLDVWERLVTSLEDGSIREVALGDADTCARSHVVWQVKTLPYVPPPNDNRAVANPKKGKAAKVVAPANQGQLTNIADALAYLYKQASTSRMAAKLASAAPDPDPCITPPDSRYRGAENQLYRVEIHTGGTAAYATFKWSRDNGSVIFPVDEYTVSATNTVVTLGHLGRDDRSSLQVGDWVEILDDNYVLREEPGSLLRVTVVDTENYVVTLDGQGPLKSVYPGKNALLRRWDHINRSPDLTVADNDKAFRVVESNPGQTEQWLTLENGIQIKFDGSSFPDNSPRTYQSGDYWLIPARTNTGDIEWPTEEDQSNPPKQIPKFLWAEGVAHHYAPLAGIQVADGRISNIVYSYQGTDSNGNNVDIPLRRSLSDIPLFAVVNT